MIRPYYILLKTSNHRYRTLNGRTEMYYGSRKGNKQGQPLDRLKNSVLADIGIIIDYSHCPT